MTLDALFAMLPSMAFALINGMMLFFVQRAFKKFEDTAADRTKDRQKETMLIMSNLDAMGTLVSKTAICVKNDKVNGDMEYAEAAYHAEKRKMREFLREQAVKANHG